MECATQKMDDGQHRYIANRLKLPKTNDVALLFKIKSWWHRCGRKKTVESESSPKSKFNGPKKKHPESLKLDRSRESCCYGDETPSLISSHWCKLAAVRTLQTGFTLISC